MRCLFVTTFIIAALSPILAYAAPATASDYNWQGFYVGGEIGGGFGNASRDFSTGRTTGTFSTSGVVGGGETGYNWQFGPTVIGIEGDISASGVSGSTSCPSIAFNCKVNNTWLGTLRPRIGYSIDRFLPYITGGLAVGDVHSHSSNFLTGALGTDFSDTESGWTLGGGVELPIYANWSAKIEYLYVNLNDAGGTANEAHDVIGRSHVSFDENIVRAGINYKF